MFYQIFLAPQVKRCGIITYKHGIYELPYELPNDLRKCLGEEPTTRHPKKNPLNLVGCLLNKSGFRRNKPLRRNINSKKQALRHLFFV